MSRPLWIAFGVLAGAACGNDQAPAGGGNPVTDKGNPPTDAAPAAAPAADAAAPAAPLGLRGTIYDDGKPRDLAASPLVVFARACREADLPSVSVAVDFVRDTDLALKIGGDWKQVKLGQKYEPRTAGDPSKESPVEVGAYASEDPRRGSSYTLPVTAWVRFDALSARGPIDVTFEADFGPRGRAEGRLRVETTEENTCRIPAPPPPPPR